MRLRVALWVAALLAGATGSAAAHHSFAMFDMQKEVTLQGAVKEFQWTNPHAWIQLMVKDADGKEVEWAIECQAVSGMQRVGWTRRTLKVGDLISVGIHPLKTIDQRGGSLVWATINGQKLSGGGGGVRPEEASGAAP
jgi:hypothetical protein